MITRKVIIVPDVHGRDFWKDIKKYKSPVIFLGDYVDPYEDEGITPEQAIENFKEIIEFAKSRDNVTLLLGNHDMEYSVGKKICECRCDYKNYDEIRKLFWDNADLFKVSTMMEINDKKFLFSHAGFTQGWVENHKDVFCYPFEATLKDWDWTNRCYRRGWDTFTYALGDVSHWRGGYANSGSMVWADVREHLVKNTIESSEYIQVFGHSWCKKPLHIVNGYEWYMLDCNKSFYIDQNGVMKYLSDNSVVELDEI